MTDDISNKTLAALLAVAVVVSLGGTLIVLKSGSSITGLSTDIESGTANVTITAQASLTIPGALIDFGAGAVNAGNDSCLIDSGATPGVDGNVCGSNGTWIAVTDGANSDFVLRNEGNVNLTVDMYTASTAATFIGGGAGAISDPQYNFQSATSDTEPGCTSGTVTTWTAVNTTSPGSRVCTGLQYGTGTRQMEVDLQLLIPSDAPPGDNQDTVTFTGTSL